MPSSIAPAGLSESPAGSAYLLCFGEPGLHVTGSRYARHYIGWTADRVEIDDTTAVLDGEVGTYDLDSVILLNGNREGKTHHGATVFRGIPIVRAAMDAGLTVTLARVWSDVDAAYAARLRAGKRSPRLCPECRPAPRQAAQAPS